MRTDSVSGIITCVFGILMAGFAGAGLMIVAGQRVIMSMMSDQQAQQSAALIDTFQAIHGVWLIYLPIMLAGGLVFAVAGYFLSRGSQVARRVAQGTAICGYVWIVAYTIGCYPVLNTFPGPFSMLPEAARQVFNWSTIVMSTVFAAFFPTFLLFILSRPRDRADTPLA